MSRTKSLLRAALAIGAAGAIAAFGTFSAFSSTTTNPGNELAAGTVELTDNDASAPLYLDNKVKPGQTLTRCIKVSYGGSLDAGVKLYLPDAVGNLGQYVNLKITPGTQASSTFPDCAGFNADASGDLFDGTLQSFRASHSSWANGLSDNPGSTTKWATSDSVVYRFQLTLQDTPAAEGEQTGAHAFTWEARNQ